MASAGRVATGDARRIGPNHSDRVLFKTCRLLFCKRAAGQSADSFNMPNLFAAVVILAGAGIAMTAGFTWIEKRLVPWTND